MRILYFKKIEIHGFKSFAEYVNIEFHDGITCIVGPNGSGKSNISDAIKWVLGEQSPKSLRGGKMQDVIFAGTEKRKPRGMAEVTLTIDNTRSILPIDYTEVAVTRRMYRSGESEYSINNNTCRLRDIKELFMDTGIGVDGYSIIGQGKISEIINSKPENRRELFEEAAGIVKYRTRKNEAERKLNSTNQNLLRIYDIIKELELRVEPLREESQLAKEFLELKERYKTIEINLTLKNIDNLEERLKAYHDEIEALKTDIEKYMDEKQRIDENYYTNKIKNEELSKSSIEIQENLIEKIENISHGENQVKINNEKKLSIDKDYVRLSSELETIESKIEKEKKELVTQKESQGISQKKFEEVKKLQLEKDTYIEERNRLVDQKKLESETLKSKLIESQNNIFTKKSEVQNIESLRNSLDKRKNQIENESATQKNENTEIDDNFQKFSNEKNNIQSKIESNTTELQNMKIKYNEEIFNERQLIDKLNVANNKLSESVTRQKLLIDLDNSYEGYNNAVKYLMKNDHIKAGIHGVVADVVDVPAGFEVAIETAFGAALQNIICQDDYSAKRAIDLLKRNRAGRVTFLPVESIKSYSKNMDHNRISKLKGFKGLAVERISFNETYREIMNYLVGRVVIADNIENAIAMSKSVGNGMRVVTLEGEVINSSGAISGGSFKTNTNSILSRKAETRKLSDTIIELEEEYNKIKVEIEAKKRIIKNTSERIITVDNELKIKNSKFMEIENELNKIENSINLIKLTEGKRENEILEIQLEEKNASDIIEKLNIEIKKMIYEAKSTESKAKESTLDYEATNIAKANLIEEINNLKLNVVSRENEYNNLCESIRRIETTITGLVNEMSCKTNMVSQLEKQRVVIENENIDYEEKLTSMRLEKEQTEIAQKEHAEEREKLAKLLEEKTERKENIDKEINNIQTKKHEIEIKLTKSETQIDGLKDKLWDEFEISYIQAIEMKNSDFKVSIASKEAREIRERLREIGDVNIGSINEYETVRERYDFLIEQRDDLLEAIETLQKVIEDMDKIIRVNFLDTFNKVAKNFTEVFSEIFGGGRAELKMNNEDDILTTGIEIIAQPPGKNLRNINLLSGGEKTLTAVALTFAILKVKPTPFCILDEIEAALDDVNINRFVSYLKNFEDIQFVLVTHQKATMEFADVLYGVTMAEQGISKVLSLKLEEKAG